MHWLPFQHSGANVFEMYIFPQGYLALSLLIDKVIGVFSCVVRAAEILGNLPFNHPRTSDQSYRFVARNGFLAASHNAFLCIDRFFLLSNSNVHSVPIGSHPPTFS